MTLDVTERRHAEAARHALEVRQAFLVRLDDALRPLADAAVIQDTAARVLGEHLGVTRAMYADVEGEPGAEVGFIRGQYLAGAPAAAPFPERYAYSAFGERVMARRRRGDTMVVADVTTDPTFDAPERAAWLAGDVRAAITVSLVKDGRFVADFGVQSAAPRVWTADDVALVEATAERTWAAVERARAEAERERLLRVLEVERSRLAAVFAQAPSVLAIVRGPEHVLVMANEAYLAVNGHRGVLGKPLLDAVPELRDQGFDRLLDRVVATGEPYVGREIAIWLSTAPGAPPEERFFDFVYLPLVEPDASGAPTRVGVIAHGNDITEQVRARREAEQARERADRLQALTAALAATTTPEQVADVVVAQGVAATGAVTGMLALRVVPPSADGPGEGAVLRHQGLSPAVVAAYTRFPLSRAGPVAECLHAGAVVFAEDGAALRTRFPAVAHLFDDMGTEAIATVPLAVAGDVVGAMSFSWGTPRRLSDAERELFLAFGRQAAQALERARLFEAERAARAQAEQARAEAEAANRAKSEFLAVMSHELRTPLNAIGGYAELMAMGIRGPVTAEQREDLRRLQASQRHLLGLINEVLNYAKLETGAVRYDVVAVDVREALAAAEALVAPQAQAKGLALTVAEGPPDAGGRPLAVRADAEKLRQILVNLLSNAVKFTEPGGRIELAARGPGREDAGRGDAGRVHLLVRDTGVGIAADQLERIFDPFVQVRADLTRTAEGTGLGLAISRDLARGMGGDLTVESAPGVGSTFTLALPRA